MRQQVIQWSKGKMVFSFQFGSYRVNISEKFIEVTKIKLFKYRSKNNFVESFFWLYATEISRCLFVDTFVCSVLGGK